MVSEQGVDLTIKGATCHARSRVILVVTFLVIYIPQRIYLQIYSNYTSQEKWYSLIIFRLTASEILYYE